MVEEQRQKNDQKVPSVLVQVEAKNVADVGTWNLHTGSLTYTDAVHGPTEKTAVS